MSPIESTLNRLEKVRQRQPGQWSARCPAHADKGPSLSVRETPDGAVLLHCFAGCTTTEIVSAMGLAMADLFPPSNTPRRPPPAPGVSRRELIEAADFERSILFILKCDAMRGRDISQNDMQRGHLARKRIAHAEALA